MGNITSFASLEEFAKLAADRGFEVDENLSHQLEAFDEDENTVGYVDRVPGEDGLFYGLLALDHEDYMDAMESTGEEPWDGFNSDAEADADVLASAGYGTDEDYNGGCFMEDDY